MTQLTKQQMTAGLLVLGMLSAALFVVFLMSEANDNCVTVFSNIFSGEGETICESADASVGIELYIAGVVAIASLLGAGWVYYTERSADGEAAAGSDNGGTSG